MISKAFTVTAATVLLSAFAAGSAHAQTQSDLVVRQSISHGVVGCVAARTIFDTNLRKRPRALSNEGATTAFVTCDFNQVELPTQSVRFVSVAVTNRNDVKADVTCTLLDGFASADLSAAVTITATVDTGATGPIVFDPVTVNSGVQFSAPSLSCALPGGVEIVGVGIQYDAQDFGAP